MKAGKSGKSYVIAAVFTAGILLFSGNADTVQAKTSDTLRQWNAGVGALLEGELSANQEVLEKQESSSKQQADSKEDAAKKNDLQEEESSGEQAESSLVMANVENVLNVREEPSEDAPKAGYLYADCGGEVLERKDGWTKLESGELTGWAKDEYLLFGEEAEELADDVGLTEAVVTTQTLRVRMEPDEKAKVLDLAAEGDAYEVLDAEQLDFSDNMTISEDWVAVDFEGDTGFVSADYVQIRREIDQGETIEQVKQREEAEKAQEEQQAEEQEGKEDKTAQSSEESDAQEKKAERTVTQAVPAGTDEVMLLASLIHCEAGNQPYEGQLAVGAVVMNRVKSSAYPDTIYDVIFASGQFGPAGRGDVARRIAEGSVKQSCIQAATEAISGVTNVRNATHFRRAGSRDGIVIGNHVFW